MPQPPLNALDVPGYWLAPAVEALLLILSGEDALEPLARAAQLDEADTALFLCLSLAVSGHGDRIHASWLGTAFGDLSTDRPVTPGQRALWTAAARGAYGPAGKIFVLRRLDAAAVSSAAEPDRWLAALVSDDTPTFSPSTLPVAGSDEAGTLKKDGPASSPSTPPAAGSGKAGTSKKDAPASSPSTPSTFPAAGSGKAGRPKKGASASSPSALPAADSDRAATSKKVVDPDRTKIPEAAPIPKRTSSPAPAKATRTAAPEPAGTPGEHPPANTPGSGTDAGMSPDSMASPALAEVPVLAGVPELVQPVQAAARLTRLLERCVEITSARPSTIPRSENPGPWPDEEPLRALRSLVGSREPDPEISLTDHLLEDVRSSSDPHLAAIAFHVAAPVVRSAAEELAEATHIPPPTDITVPILGNDVILRPEGPDAASLTSAEERIRAEAVPRGSGRWLVYGTAMLPIVALALAFTVSELFAIAALVLGGIAGFLLWRLSLREQAEARRVEADVARLREQAEAAVWALHDYARETTERSEAAAENLAALVRLLRRGPAVADQRP
ncbi:hypothetical protein [Sphaerisporangium corydalis]|uniref:Uncharacterized protein n=1 Tax=Sphaerisporangium corydalis TaxID=1441875 RepID=A0ABV9EUF5_9ACTN|nr:hypothetical protein [Sphaerisporangium corydalis]